MTIKIKVPGLPESVADAVVAEWHVKVGDNIQEGDQLVDLETDKVMLEVPALSGGVIKEILKGQGDTVVADEVLATLTEQSATSKGKTEVLQVEADKKPAAFVGAPDSVMSNLSPVVRRMLAEHMIDSSQIVGTGKDGRITKVDITQFIEQRQHKTVDSSDSGKADSATVTKSDVGHVSSGKRIDRREPLSRLRARIAERLVSAQREAAMLTTFNEINMQAVKDLRARYRDQFEKTHGVRLGFMSFFVRAVAVALQRFPKVNASIEGQDIIYHDYIDISVAIGSPRGLVVPVIRDADTLKMADIEKVIMTYADRARNNKLTIEEMTGGTFTITNGGVFGSMLSTPIINPPQSAILGMHNIVERPIAENGQIIIRPIMYLALSYDHRIIDGSESVRFLVTIKQLLEEPERLLLDV